MKAQERLVKAVPPAQGPRQWLSRTQATAIAEHPGAGSPRQSSSLLSPGEGGYRAASPVRRWRRRASTHSRLLDPRLLPKSNPRPSAARRSGQSARERLVELPVFAIAPPLRVSLCPPTWVSESRGPARGSSSLATNDFSDPPRQATSCSFAIWYYGCFLDRDLRVLLGDSERAAHPLRSLVTPVRRAHRSLR